MCARTIVTCAAVAVGALVLTACDPAEDFTFVSETVVPIRVSWRTATTEDPGERYSYGEYLLGPGESAKTSEDPTVDGDLGAPLFSEGRVLPVTATAGEVIVFDRLFTYGELKEMDFRVVITDER